MINEENDEFNSVNYVEVDSISYVMLVIANLNRLRFFGVRTLNNLSS